MRLGALRRAAIALGVVWTLQSVAADLIVIDLHNRTADQVIPVLRPLLNSSTVLSGQDYKLFVRGQPEDVARIRQTLAIIDRAPRQLLVSVRYAAAGEQSAQDVGLSGRANRQGAQVTISGSARVGTVGNSSISQVRVLEGASARITSGQSVPMIVGLYMTQRGTQSASGVALEYQDVDSGFVVTPRINGQQVFLDVAAQQQRLDNAGVAAQRIATTVTGALGEWIELGGVQESGTQQSRVVGFGASQRAATQSDDRAVAVKVELLQSP